MSGSGELTIIPDEGSANSNTTNTTSCTSPFESNDYRIVAIVGTCTASVSALSCLFVIVLIVLLKRYEFFTWRLVLYLTIVAGIQAISLIVNRIDYHFINTATENYCIFSAFLDQQTIMSVLMAVVCITINLFINAVLQKKTSKLEPLYIFLIFVFPIFFSWIPFIHHTYGRAGAWCWIRSVTDDNCSRFVFGTVLQFVLWYAPLYASLIVLFVIWLLIKWKLAKRKSTWVGRYDHQAELVKEQIRKEIEPLVWYPLVFIILNLPPLANRIQGCIYPRNPILGLWLLTAIFLPLQGGLVALTFFLHPSNLKSLRWKYIKMAMAAWRYKEVVKEFPLEANVTEDSNENGEETMDVRHNGFVNRAGFRTASYKQMS